MLRPKAAQDPGGGDRGPRAAFLRAAKLRHRPGRTPPGVVGAPPPPSSGASGSAARPTVHPYNPRVPPVTQPSSSVQQRKEVWIIEVRRRDGTVQTFPQSYPALFQVGDEVWWRGTGSGFRIDGKGTRSVVIPVANSNFLHDSDTGQYVSAANSRDPESPGRA